MARSKDKNELEHLRGENRSLQKENRRLKKLLRQQERFIHTVDEDIIDGLLEEELNRPPKREKCTQCGIGFLTEIHLGIKELIKCSECSYRKTREIK